LTSGDDDAAAAVAAAAAAAARAGRTAAVVASSDARGVHSDAVRVVADNLTAVAAVAPACAAELVAGRRPAEAAALFGSTGALVADGGGEGARGAGAPRPPPAVIDGSDDGVDGATATAVVAADAHCQAGQWRLAVAALAPRAASASPVAAAAAAVADGGTPTEPSRVATLRRVIDYLACTGRPVDATDGPTHHLSKPAGGLALLVRADE